MSGLNNTDLQGKAVREGFNRVARQDSAVRVGTAMCGQCKVAISKDALCFFGCVSAVEGASVSCAECTATQNGGKGSFRRSEARRNQSESLQTTLGEVLGRLRTVGEVVRGEGACESSMIGVLG